MWREIDWIENRASLSPDQTAVIDADQNQIFTYAQINSRARAIAAWLVKRGVRKGDRIALLSPNHIAYFDLLFACTKIGAVFVPLNWRLSVDELNYILADSSPILMGYHSKFQDKIDELYTDKDKIFCINNSEFNEIVNGQYCLTVDTLVAEEDAALIIYTGGTTGKPKGVVLAHRSILFNAINTILSWSLTDRDCTLTSMPMFHTGGLNVLSLPLLLMGGKVVITEAFSPVKSIEFINEYKCTIVIFVPTMYHMLFETKEFQNSFFPSIKTFLSGGAPCPLEVYEVFNRKGIAFKEGYGLTEAGPNNFFIDPVVANQKRGSVGKPMLLNTIKLVTDDGREAEPNEVGEIIIKGKHVFDHYWNNTLATEEVFQDGWLHTGDLARKDEEGFFYIVGRKKDMIITGGENVYPLEIENWLGSHSDIIEAAIIGIPDEKWGEVVTAFVVANSTTITAEQLVSFCEYKLGKYKIPRKFIFLPELPKTHVGKIDKKRLKEIGIKFLNMNSTKNNNT
ncbi:o-succinylbenzoate--CoA ligase [Neobacillus sp. LXY-4]|uniref:o-succinylbenzoate--CoA ligase n=1 Tax=Neobacillus sp. LXY-4 TaxID=3379826 RepID=UPI003EDE9BB9